MSEELQQQRETRRKMMLEDPIAKVIVIVSVPMIVSMLIDSVYNITDTYWISQMGTAATAAVGVNGALMQLIRSISLGFGVGASSYISRLLGAKRDGDACRVGTTIFITALAALSFLAVMAYIFIDPLVVLLGATESVKPYSMDYASWLLLATPFTAGEVVLSQLLRSEGSTKYAMIGMVSGCVLNIGLDPIFIYGLDLQVAGAAMATGLSKIVSFMVLFSPFLRGKTLLLLRPRLFTPRKDIYFEVARMGVPTLIRSGLLSVSNIVTNNIAGQFSDSALAAVSVANKCTRVVGSAIVGLGQGFQPVAGYCWGAKKYARVRKAFWTCSAMGAGGGIVLGAVLAAVSSRLVSLFTASNDAEIIRIGSFMIIAQCITMVPHVWAIICNGMFQALGKAFSSALLGLSRQGICLIPAVLILSAVFGVYGLASAQAAADVLSFMIALPMVLKLFREIKQMEKAAQDNRLQKRREQPEYPLKIQENA